MIRVIVADDQALVRAGLVRMLEDREGIKVVAEAASGEEAIALTKKHTPDVVLMDIRMPGIGGLAATERLLRAELARVLVITGFGDDEYATRLMALGASGFLTKGAAVDEVVKAIRCAKAGQRYVSPEVAQAMALKALEPSDASPFSRLSDREMQIAQMIIDCVKVAEISDRLCLSPKTVNSYRYRIFEKMSIRSDVELMRLAVRHGLVEGAAEAG